MVQAVPAATSRNVPEIPDLADAATRERLSPAAVKALVRLADLWGLSRDDMCALLGGISISTWNRMRKSPRALTQDELTRASALIGIFKGLRLVLSEPLVDEWVTRPNADPLFNGQRPLDAMIAGGIPVMLATRGYIDAVRGGA